MAETRVRQVVPMTLEQAWANYFRNHPEKAYSVNWGRTYGCSFPHCDCEACAPHAAFHDYEKD